MAVVTVTSDTVKGETAGGTMGGRRSQCENMGTLKLENQSSPHPLGDTVSF